MQNRIYTTVVNVVLALNIVGLLYTLYRLGAGISPEKDILFFIGHCVVIALLVIANSGWGRVMPSGLPSYFLHNRESDADQTPP